LQEAGRVIVRMWEVRAEPATFPDLIAWVCEHVLPMAEVNPTHISSEVFSSADSRLVVISKWRSTPMTFADPPPNLIIRRPQWWDFAPVDR
jgi:hypothetical protein